MPKKKVLHLSQSTGGVKTYVEHILNYADNSEFEFVIIAPPNSYFERFCAEKSIRYYGVDLHRGNNIFKNLTSLRQIIGVYKNERPDIVHAHSAKGGFLGRLATKFCKSGKLIYTPHAFSYLPFTGVRRMVFFMLEILARKWTDFLLGVSYSESNRACYELGYNKSNVETILNSIPIYGGLVSNPASDVIQIKMIGRLTQQKNHLLFLEIADTLLKKYSNLKFSILGAGIHDELKGTIEQFLNDRGLKDKIFIESWGNSDTSKEFLLDADIFLMTSVFEGLPFSLLEAMSMGVACVVTKVDGNTDVINNYENGFSCLSLEEFCNKVELLINDPVLRTDIGMRGYEYIKNKHNILVNIKRLEDIYRQILL